MEQLARQALEDKIRDFCLAGDYNSAITCALRDGYGREILSFLLARHRKEDDAQEVFGRFSEALVKSIRGFSWASTFRTWAYVLAVRASRRHIRETRQSRRRTVPLPENSSALALWKELLSSLGTELRPSFVKLRENLLPEDRTLLILRVDRELEWRDIAHILDETETEMDENALAREAARLRKRFQLLVDKLREQAKSST